MSMGIVWDPKLAVGVRVIDEQHQELFRQVNALLQAMEQGKGREVIANLLAYLKSYVVEHFGAEQKLMTQHRYPEQVAHEEQHDGFVRTFLELSSEFEKTGPTITLALKVNTLVCPWLRLHVGTSDRKLGQFLNARRAEPKPATA